MDSKDINAEYENIFGVKLRPTLFDGDEEYAQMRQEIINSPRQEVNSSLLPFDDIGYYFNDELARLEDVKKFGRRNIRAFFIRKYEEGKLKCYGAGYFNKSNSKFVLVRLSFSQFNEYHKYLLESIPSLRDAFEDNFFNITDGIIQLDKQLPFNTASLAASFILGESANYKQWKDVYDLPLEFYYSRFQNIHENDPELKNVSILIERYTTDEASDQPNFKSVEDGLLYVMRVLKSPILNLVSTLKQLNSAPSVFKIPSGKRVFIINRLGCCDAYGYFDEDTNSFYICKGSRLSLNESYTDAQTLLTKLRHLFLDKACTQFSDYYVVNNDTICESATLAACYAMGENVNYSLWRDECGESLDNFYSKDLLINYDEYDLIINKVSEIDYLHLEHPYQSLLYNATASYNTFTRQITLKKGSLLSLHVTSSFRYTIAGVRRLNIISKYSKKQANGYLLNADIVLSDPDIAASIVAGFSLNGWSSWKNSEGISLGEIVTNK